MKIAENSVVSFHYTLTNGAGELVDTSREGEPLPYLHGANNIVQGLEEALVGKQSGDKFRLKCPPILVMASIWKRWFSKSIVKCLLVLIP